MTPAKKSKTGEKPSTAPVSGEANSDAVRPALRWVGLALALVPWLFWPWSGLLDPFGAPKWIAAALAVAILAGLMLRDQANRIDDSPVANWRGPAGIGAGMIIVGMILSSFFSPMPGLGLRTTLREAWIVLGAFVLASCAARKGELRWVLICLIAACGAQALLALVQHFAAGLVAAVAPNLALGHGARGSMIGTFGNPEYVAGWLACGMSAAVIWAWKGLRPPGPSFAKILSIVAAALCLFSIFVSGGRGAILASAGALVIAAMAIRERRVGDLRRKMKKSLGVVSIVVGIVIALATLSTHRSLGIELPRRMVELSSFQSDSLRHRIGLYCVTAQMIRKHPLFGAGPGRFGAAYGETARALAAIESDIGFWANNDLLAGQFVGEAHCDPLQWWAEYGLLPVAGLSLILAAAVGLGTARLKNEPELAALWAALLTMTFGMWVSFPLHDAPRAMTFWMLAGLIAGARREPVEEKAREKEA